MVNPLCISTLDLRFFHQGGIVTKAMVFARVATAEGFSPFFLTPSVSLHRTLRRRLYFSSVPSVIKSNFQGYPCYQLGAQYPEFEFNAHRFKKHALKEVFSSPIPCFAVSGNNHAARPFLDMGLPFSVWPSTTFWEDCCDRVQNAPWSGRKVLDLLTKPISEKLEHHVFVSAHQIAADSRYTAKQIFTLDSSLAYKTKLIPIPVDVRFFYPIATPSRQSLLFIGRVSDPRKNVILLLKAFEECAQHRPNLHLTLVGPCDEAFYFIIRKHPFSERIHCTGLMSDRTQLRNLLQQALALIIPSFQEGFGAVGAESLACGVPVISTPCGGPEDYVLHKQTGLLLKGFETKEMTEAILQISGDTSLRKRLAFHAREFAVSNLSIEAVQPLLCEFIHSKLLDFSNF